MTEPTEPSEAGEPTAEAETSEAEAVEGDAPAEPDAEPQETDFEGPRRRARREREERRAAQARATAIEEARREAKRRATGIVTTKKVGHGTVRGLKLLMWSALISVIVVGLGLLLYFTPVMSARNIVVVGLGAVTQEEVTNAAAVAPGTPLLQVDTDTVAERIAGIRRVATVRVQREYPSTLRVTIVEREPVVVKDYPDGPHLFDRDGVDFAIGVPPPGVPYLDTKNPGPHDAPTKAALEVMTSLRPEVAAQVARVDAPSVAAITLQLTDGRQVIWGTTDRTEEKALKLGALLTQPGKTYDVSSPDLPTVK
ncbi:cell division protein FtsQ/DivIB [Mycolicibacterium gadium]|jgi:cell division protein FtsQ|uniref:Cell division protein FtsQ n=1 Tax=Mycolicibacterium gadium TaxID=1794 RepID=A0A7I7WI20_MYCGU|nr:cell division protein FtsQ/DivIB [Mycolicibacterium gadium]BBZ16141.1 cell division protein FtsQ [Mycolicibacterium gadium]